MSDEDNQTQATDAQASSVSDTTEAKKSSKKDKPKLDAKTVNVKVYSPFKVYFNGPAFSVSAENETGPFDILPKHYNFMTLLNPGIITVRTEQKDQKFQIARGVMHVKNNGIIIFLDV